MCLGLFHKHCGGKRHVKNLNAVSQLSLAHSLFHESTLFVTLGVAPGDTALKKAEFLPALTLCIFCDKTQGLL